MEKKLDGNYTSILQAILNKSWRQRPKKQLLYGHQPPIMKTIKIRLTRHAGHCWRSKDELICDVFLWTSSHGRAKAALHTAALKTCRKQWTIGRGWEREGDIRAATDDDDEKQFKTTFLSIWFWYKENEQESSRKNIPRS